MSNENAMCASLGCRTIIREGDVRIKIGRFTYCELCALLKQEKEKKQCLTPTP